MPGQFRAAVAAAVAGINGEVAAGQPGLVSGEGRIFFDAPVERPVGRFDPGKGVFGPAAVAEAAVGETGQTLRIGSSAGTPKQFQALYGLPGRENLFCPG